MALLRQCRDAYFAPEHDNCPIDAPCRFADVVAIVRANSE